MQSTGPGIAHRARSLRGAAAVLQRIAGAGAIAGVFTGVGIVTHTQTGTGALVHTKTHPWVAAGYAVIIAAVLAGACAWCLARALALYAADVGERHGVDVNERAPSKLPPFAQRPQRS